MILPRGVIVLIADGGRMLLLRNTGDAQAPDLEVIAHRDRPAPPNRDLSSAAPGRSFSSASPRRSAYDEGDPHARQEHAFLDAAAKIAARQIDQRTPGIIVAADPLSLGYLREHYPKPIADKVLAELAKDFTGMPVEAITAHLLAV
ncbi:MAG: host attachment family protein [Erythrobacter sp.]